MTLIELMVALAIGAFLMIGAITVFMQSRATFRVTDSMSRLQENGRFVLDILEVDIRMAGFWGLSRRADQIMGRAQPAEANGVGKDICGQNWLIDLTSPIAGTNDDYNRPNTCPALDPRETDTLVVRRVDEDPTPPATVSASGNNFTLYVLSRRGGPELGEIFVDNSADTLPAGWIDPVGTDVYNELHRLVVNGYYVSNQSSAPALNSATTPSLRVQTLTGCPPPAPLPACTAGNEGTIEDREILSGVEDFQVQFGVDTDASGTESEAGVIDGWVNPDDASLANPDTAVLAVRIWVRIRAELEERGFNDGGTTYNYAGVSYTPTGTDRNFRRIVVTKTIYVRNARPVGG